MRKLICQSLFVVLFNLLLVGCTENRPVLKFQYSLTPDQIINTSGCGYGTRVADEQNAASPETVWEPFEKKYCIGLKAILAIALDQEVKVADVYVLSKATSPARLRLFSQGQQTHKQEIEIKKGWNKFELNTRADLIEIQFVGQEVSVAEVLIDADKPYPALPKPISKRDKPLMQDFIGTNAFVDVPIALLEPFGCVREYHDWPWNEPERDSLALNITTNGFDFQGFYTNMRAMGKLVVPCLQKNPKWLNPTEQGKPTQDLQKTEDPKVYTRHSLFMKRYVENFIQEVNGEVKYYENWNEHDKWWEGNESYFSPYQYASMSSADVDGHLHTMGADYGFRTKENGAKHVMSGLANIKLDYVHALKYWSDKYRNGDFAWDVINYHQYANSSQYVDDKPLAGISPEAAHIYEKTGEIVAFRDKYLPNVEVWNSEFGYDTETSPQQAPAIKEKSADLVQADWLIRSYLLLSATGIEKAFQYMIRDAGTENYFATSGLYTSTLKNAPYRKASWYYISTLRNMLYDSHFKSLYVDSLNHIYTVLYENKIDTLLKTMIIWHGSNEGKVTKNYELPTSVRNGARLTEFSATSSCGNSKMLEGTTITLSETPVIVQQHPKKMFSKCNELAIVDINSITCVDHNGVTDRTLLDEQVQGNDPAMGADKLIPKTLWVGGYAEGKVEERIFDLGDKKNLHSVQVFDAGGIGDVDIFVKQQDAWKQVGRINLNLYNKWKGCAINAKSRFVKMVRSSGWADMGEVLFYENKIY